MDFTNFLEIADKRSINDSIEKLLTKEWVELEIQNKERPVIKIFKESIGLVLKDEDLGIPYNLGIITAHPSIKYGTPKEELELVKFRLEDGDDILLPYGLKRFYIIIPKSYLQYTGQVKPDSNLYDGLFSHISGKEFERPVGEIVRVLEDIKIYKYDYFYCKLVYEKENSYLVKQCKRTDCFGYKSKCEKCEELGIGGYNLIEVEKEVDLLYKLLIIK